MWRKQKHLPTWHTYCMHHAPSTPKPSTDTWNTHAMRLAMFRFARLHIQPDEEAEDAVQDAWCALLEKPEKIAQTEDVKRYLFGILKNKITDRLRQKYRNAQYQITEPDDLDQVLFHDNGHWVKALAPSRWQTPEAQLQSEAFFTVVDVCVNNLPPKIARIFSMKEFLECETSEICTTLNLSKTDYWQCMSRARKKLQMCLDTRWFQKEVT